MLALRIIALVLGLACLAAPAAANITVEAFGRIYGANLTTGPWAGARVGEYVHITFDVPDTGIIIDPGQANNVRQYPFISNTFKMTVRGQTVTIRTNAAGTDPSMTLGNDYPVADGLFIFGAADFVPLVVPGTTTAVYDLLLEWHDSSGDAWNFADISQNLGAYGPGTFDFPEWTITSTTNGTGFGIEFIGLIIRLPNEALGSCCLGDGWCAMTSAGGCVGDWAQGEECEGPCTPAGACCKGNGTCELLTQAACEAIPHAVYAGDNTACTAGVCPPAGGCCIGATCSILNETACVNSGGTWRGAGTNCEIQPQYYQTVQLNLPDATGGFGGNPLVPGVFTNAFTLTDATTIQSLEVWLDFGTSRINDHKIRLTGPNGTTLDLMTRIGATPPECTTTPIGPGYATNARFVFQDSAPLTIYQHVTNLPTSSFVPGARVKPASCGGTVVVLDAPSPAGFGGISLAGTWTLEVRDERSGIAGYLYGWGLSLNGGAPAPCSPTCGSADFDGDGDTGTDADIESFFACLGGNCCPTCASADFDADGDTGTDADIEAFFRVLGGGTC